MANPTFEVIGMDCQPHGPEFNAEVLALVPRVLPEAKETIRLIHALYAELMAIRAQAQETQSKKAL